MMMQVGFLNKQFWNQILICSSGQSFSKKHQQPRLEKAEQLADLRMGVRAKQHQQLKGATLGRLRQESFGATGSCLGMLRKSIPPHVSTRC